MIEKAPWPSQVRKYLLAFFAFSLAFMPYKVQLSSILLILLGVTALFGPWKSLGDLVKRPSSWLLAWFLLSCIGILWAPNFDLALKDIQMKLPFLVFPLVLHLERRSKHLPSLIDLFKMGVVVAAVLCIVLALYRFLLTNDYSQFVYGNLSLFHHPSYFSMFINLAVFGLFQTFLKAENDRPVLYLALFLTAFNAFLLSRTGMVINLLILLYFGVQYLRAGKGRRLIFPLIILMSVGSVAVLNKKVQIRLADGLNFFKENPNRKEESKRLVIWSTALEYVGGHTILGSGSGNNRSAMQEQFSEMGLSAKAERQFNAHNQFLENWIELGLLGFLIFVALFVHSFLWARKHKAVLFVGFLAICTLAFMSESMLERQAGIFFFAFFLSVFSIGIENMKDEGSVDVSHIAN